jgi:multimeric flavodoxin WrbA
MAENKKQYTDEELLAMLEIDKATLERFKEIQQITIEEAKKLEKKKDGKINVLGISGSARDIIDTAQENSNSEKLLEVCLDACSKLGAVTELVSLRKHDIQHCKACYSTVNTQCHFYCSCYAKGTSLADDMTNLLYDKILEADAIIFATPVNNFKISTLMATFLDRCISLDGSLAPADVKIPKNKELNIKHMKFIELMADDNVLGSGFLKRFFGKVAGIITTGHEEGASLAISNLFLALNGFGMLFPPVGYMYAMSSVCLPTYADKKIVTSECYVETARDLAENVMALTKKIKGTSSNTWKSDYSSN